MTDQERVRFKEGMSPLFFYCLDVLYHVILSMVYKILKIFVTYLSGFLSIVSEGAKSPEEKDGFKQ